MKYIIESNDVIGYTPKYAMLFGDGYMIQPLEDLEELTADYINEHFGDLQDTAYQKGFEDGKAVNDKGCEGCKYSGTPQGDSPCFNCSNYYTNNWTAKDDKIEVGDEVEVAEKGIKFFVTKIYDADGTVGGINKDGEVRYWSRSLVKPTGRHFNIVKILEGIKHD